MGLMCAMLAKGPWRPSHLVRHFGDVTGWRSASRLGVDDAINVERTTRRRSSPRLRHGYGADVVIECAARPGFGLAVP